MNRRPTTAWAGGPALLAVLLAGGDAAAVSPVSTNPITTQPLSGLPGRSLEELVGSTGNPAVRPSYDDPSGYGDERIVVTGTRRTGTGQQGGSAQRVRWLVNGVQVPRDAMGVIPDQSIDRIELLKEGASSIYGDVTLHGIINFVTNPDVPVGVPPPGSAEPRDLGYAYTGVMNKIQLSAEYLGGCDVSAGLSRPLWSYFGGEPFGGPLERDHTWYLKDIQPRYFPIPGFQTFGTPAALADGSYQPFVLAGPQPREALEAALGGTAQAPARTSAFPPGMFGGGIPPESTVLRSDACPPEIRAQLADLYRERDQARADAVYWNDFRSEFRDPARAAEARKRRDELNVRIRALLDECEPPTATEPPATAVSTGTPVQPAATPPTTPQTPKVSLNFDVRMDYGRFGTGEPGKGVGLDLSPRYDFSLPWTGQKNPDLYSGLGPVRAFTGESGQALLRLDPALAQRLGITRSDWEAFVDLHGRLDQAGGFQLMSFAEKNYLKVDVVPDFQFRVGLRIPLERPYSQIVEIGGSRSNVALGSGDGWVPDPRVRFAGLLEQAHDKVPDAIAPYFADAFNIGNRTFFVFNYPGTTRLNDNIFRGVRGSTGTYENACADAALPVPDDPGYRAAAPGGGSWGQAYDDQWAIKRVGFTTDADSAWALVPDRPAPIVIGVIDTGLDWHHADLDWNSLWRNPKEIPGNGLDDDNNGYVDDIIGWNFTNHDNHPWDHDGHGTFVAGIIAASRNNAAGIAGINPDAKIMVLKALNTFGRTRASHLARAIAYGADNGAHILNLSVAGPGLPPVVHEAIRYATSKGVLVIAAAGNTGENIGGIFPAGAAGALVVAATDPDDRRPAFSNWGPGVALAAPGVDVMSLRARRTDFMWNTPDPAVYRPGANILGADRRYYRSTGTSFAAPIVSGVASLVWGRTPTLTAADVRRILEQSARDVETPGRDQYTGYGVVDARAALRADPRFFVAAAIREVNPVQRGREVVLEVYGTADADQFDSATLEIGEGENPATFRPIGPELRTAVADGKLGEISGRELAGQAKWTLRVVTRHRDGRTREGRFLLEVG